MGIFAGKGEYTPLKETEKRIAEIGEDNTQKDRVKDRNNLLQFRPNRIKIQANGQNDSSDRENDAGINCDCGILFVPFKFHFVYHSIKYRNTSYYYTFFCVKSQGEDPKCHKFYRNYTDLPTKSAEVLFFFALYGIVFEEINAARTEDGMKDSFVIDACAKVNLFLDIVSCRADGYHQLNSVMQQISLADRLSVTIGVTDGDVMLYVNGSRVDDLEKNLVWRGADAFFSAIGERRGLTVHLEKNIPMQAGLGGGSADCAAILHGLNCVWGSPISAEELGKIGASLGADVPFCLQGGTQRAEGIGEVLSPLPAMPDCVILVAMGRETMPTPRAFAQLDEMYNRFCERKPCDAEYRSVCRALETGDLGALADGMYNIFEDAVFAQHPVLRERVELMRNMGAAGARMSGSGAAVFGLFTDAQAAENAAEEMRRSGCGAWVCTPLRGIPDPICNSFSDIYC